MTREEIFSISIVVRKGGFYPTCNTLMMILENLIKNRQEQENTITGPNHPFNNSFVQ